MNNNERQNIMSRVRKNLSSNNQFVNNVGYADRITPHFEENRPKARSYDREFFDYQKNRKDILGQSSVKRRSKEYNQTINKIREIDENAFRLFELSRNFTLKELKKRYVVLSRLTHPDKQGGSDEKFDLVTKHYMYLLEYYKRNNESRKYETKASINSLVEKKKSNRVNQDDTFSKTSLKVGQGDNFDINSFNRVFEKNALYDPNHEGYSAWLNTTNELSNNNNLPKPTTKGAFISNFDKERQKLERSIVPANINTVQSINQNSMSTMNLIDDTSNFSISDAGAMDLKEVYSSGLINVSTSIHHKPTFKSQREYEQYRSSKMTPLNQQEKLEIEQQELRFKEKEKHRLNKLAERDAAISEHYMKIQGLLQ